MRAEQGGGEPATVESLGRQLRNTIPLLRINSISIYDGSGAVLWLSEGFLGPDEHTLVQEALGDLSQDPAKECWEEKFEDSRAAVFMPLRSKERGLTGIVLVITEIHYDSDTVKSRILSTSVFDLLHDLADRIPAPSPKPLDLDLTCPEVSLPSESQLVRAAKAEIPSAAGPRPPALTLRLEDPAKEARAIPTSDIESTRLLPKLTLEAAGESPDELPLYVLPFIKLRAGGQTRRFEVLPRGTLQQNRDPGALDLLAVEKLLAWLDENRMAWTQEISTFSLNLSVISLESPTFPARLLKSLTEHRISPSTLGFEIAEPLVLQHRAKVERFIGECDRIGSFVILDNFTFDAAVLPLLRHKSVRLVKIQPKITTAVLQDKLSQAVVLAIVHAVKVLGIHCAIKKVTSQAALRWLKDVGCDLAQGDMLAPAKPIDSLKEPIARPASPTARAALDHAAGA